MFADSRRNPGCYDVDDALCADLERALFGAGTRSYATLDLPVLPNMTIDDFRRRASTVPGWDAIVALSPYGQSSALAQDGLLLAQGRRYASAWQTSSAFLRRGVGTSLWWVTAGSSEASARS
jgi:hypothetical protein